MIKVLVQEEVLDFLRRLPPQPKHAVKTAIKALARETGDIKALTDELDGFYRLRVAGYRVIFEYQVVRGNRQIVCIHAGPRKLVYEIFKNRLWESS